MAARSRSPASFVSPAFVMACRKEGLEPGARFDLSSIRTIGAAGSPLPLEGFEWLYRQFGPEVQVNLGSGGTDVCTGIVQGYPLLPVYAGEMSGRCLAVDAQAFGPDGEPVVGELGELVITKPMPSMPVGLWNDPDGLRAHAAYFDTFPGVWRHGDWIVFSERASSVITGRSDATLNRGGVRLGTSEFYVVVEELEEVLDSLVVHLDDPDELFLFVALREGVELDDELRDLGTRYGIPTELSSYLVLEPGMQTPTRRLGNASAQLDQVVVTGSSAGGRRDAPAAAPLVECAAG